MWALFNLCRYRPFRYQTVVFKRGLPTVRRLGIYLIAWVLELIPQQKETSDCRP